MTDLKTLREVAERATPGPWRVRTNRHKTTGGEEWGWVSNMTTQNISLPGMSINWEASTGHANATHIVVFNPVTVLSLLDRIEALEGALTFYRDAWDQDCDATLIGPGVWDGGMVSVAPSPALIEDKGIRARAALHPEPLGEGGGL